MPMDFPPFKAAAAHDATLSDLHKAAGLADLAAIQAALVAGADVNAADAVMGATALHLAAQSDSAEAVGLLLDAGALPNIPTHTHGMTPLMVAVWHRNPSVVERLLAHPGIDVDQVSRMGATAPGLVGGFCTGQDGNAADAEIAALFKTWSASRPATPLIDCLEDQGTSQDEKRGMIRKLLGDGADPNEVSGVSNPMNPAHTPLLIAARDGMADIVADLLQAGADMTLVDRFMRAHPAHKAAYNGRADVLEVLVAHADFPKIADIQGPFNGYTALHDACWHGHKAAAEVLLGAGVRRDLAGYDGRTPAELARWNGFGDLAGLVENWPDG